MTQRFEYRRDLTQLSSILAVDGVVWRQPSPTDKQFLAELMLDAYRDTIDYDGETLEDALNEVQSYFSGMTDTTWLEASWLAFVDGVLASASLVSFWQDRNAPLIAYVMTNASSKGKHLATAAVSRSLQSLAEKGNLEARAVITEGNIPSEKIFTRLGFERLNSG